MRRDHGAEADQAGDREDRQHRGIGAGVHGGAQGRQAAEVESRPASGWRQPAPPRRTRRRRPPTARSRPSAVRRGRTASIRGSTTSDIIRFTRDHHDQGRPGNQDSAGRPWRARRAMTSAGSKACEAVARSRNGSSAAPSTGAASSRRSPLRAARGGFGARRATTVRKASMIDGGEYAEAGRGKRRRAEERHRDGVLDRRRAGQWPTS